MKFGTNLRRSVYAPWKDYYLDYSKLKRLLREEDVDGGKPWTEADESAFVEELLNVQLEKVNKFQEEHHKALRERTSACEAKLDRMLKETTTTTTTLSTEGDGEGAGQESSTTSTTKSEGNAGQEEVLREVLGELDAISKETSELEKFSRMNFTGALKAAKKHDKRRGNNYRVKSLLQVRLASLPFNSEDYSPLLYRLSTMYTFVRQNLDAKGRAYSVAEPIGGKIGGEMYSSHKFFVHPDNLLEVKTYILRHLPVLVYTPNTVKVADGGQGDPTITSLYFDNPQFSLYNNKVEKSQGASSLRIQWFGRLADKPELVVEKKTMREGDDAEIVRLNLKSKYVMPFLKGDYKMEKQVRKLKEKEGTDAQQPKVLESTAEEIQKLVKDEDLQPILRTNYTRTAFQIPGEGRVRISIDTNLALIREDALDPDRPCREPDDWHRSDIDAAGLEYPFNSIRKGEIFRFPYAVLEIKVRADGKKKRLAWVDELMSSHLVKEAPRFSKFVQGVASLFDDYVNVFPFWTSLLDTDIRRDPNDAFEEEQARRQKEAEDAMAVGSLVGSQPKSYKKSISSPVGKSLSSSGLAARQARDTQNISRTISSTLATGTHSMAGEPDSDDDGQHADAGNTTADHSRTLKSLFPSFSTSKYARARRAGQQGHSAAAALRDAPLPAGVEQPAFWIKDQGPVKVEPKVWLANQRTFVKWQHIAVLLAALALGFYNAAGEANPAGRALAGAYTLIAVFAAVWGWAMYVVRSGMIERRSGRDFDNPVGPIVVSVGLVVGLGINFGLKWHTIMSERRSSAGNGTSAADSGMGSAEL